MVGSDATAVGVVVRHAALRAVGTVGLGVRTGHPGIAARLYDGGAAPWSTELRYRERVMGTTHDARQGMRIRYVDAAAATPSVVVSIDEYPRSLGQFRFSGVIACSPSTG